MTGGKTVFLFCAQAILVQSISSQCLGPAFAPIDNENLAWETAGTRLCEPYPLKAVPSCVEIPFLEGYGPAALVASNGGGLLIKSGSPLAITGISMMSENVYKGPLAVTGAVPFLATVALEGLVPSIGSGSIAYSCVNGNVAMLTEDRGVGLPYSGYGPYGPIPADLGYAPPAYNTGFIGPGYGCNRGYGPIF